MGPKRLPDLPDTGRRYVEDTLRARLATPGILRYRRVTDRTGARVTLAALALLALLAAMVWFAR